MKGFAPPGVEASGRMRAFKLLVATACLAAAGLVPQAGLAATHEVDTGNAYFNPSVVHAASGDTVHWTNSGGLHNWVSYGGTQSFDSGAPSGPGSEYSLNYNGGTVLYRCAPHSSDPSLSNGGTCNGMCGVITDKVGAPSTPEITSPANGSDGESNPVTVAGTGEKWTLVVVEEGSTELGRALVKGDGTWSLTVNDLSIGSHTIQAYGLTFDDVRSASSAMTEFLVGEGPDNINPTVSIGTADNSLFFGMVTISGTASDNKGVSGVSVTFEPVLPLDGTRTFEAQCLDCPLGTGGLVHWTLTVQIFTGIWEVTAVARDTWNPPNVSDPSNTVTIYSLRISG